MFFKRRKQVILLLLVSMVLSLTGTIPTGAEEKEDPISKYYGPRDGIEVEELRTETAKQYLLPDGTMQYIGSPDRIHWKDETGRYIDIDNTIIETEYNANDLLYSHTNKSSDIKMYFADNSIENEYPIRTEYRGHALSYGIEGSEISYVPREEAVFPEILTENVFLENAVMYHATDGFDLVYIPQNSGEKEYIIIHEPTETNTYIFRLRLENLFPEQTERGVVFRNDEGDSIFDIGGLFAVDSNEVYCDDVRADLLGFDGEIAILQVMVNQDWMNDENRVYPIIIDPTAIVCGEYVTADSYVSSVDANVNFYLSDYLRMGKDDDFGIRRTAIKFELPSVSSSSVTSACINIRLYSYEGSLSNTIYAYPITGTWSSSGITWNNKPSYTSSYKSTAMTTDSWHDTSNWYTFGVTTLTKRWLAGSQANYGVFLIDNIENNTSHWSTYYSSDYGYPNRPELMVDYSTSNTAKLCGIIPTDSEHNHYSFIALTTTQLNNSGYAVYPSYTSFSSVDAFTNYLYDDADVFVIKCHGDYLSNSGYSRLLIKESANTATQKWYHSQNVLNMSTDALSAYRLMVFMACEAGTNPGIGKNVTSAVVNKGARAALGFSGNINSTYSNYWCADYFSYLQQGQTVYMAKYYIQLDGNYPLEYQLNTGVLVGDTSTTLYN